MTSKKMERVVVSFEGTWNDEPVVERMHAISNGDGTFVLDNSPFYVYGLSFEDVFAAKNEDGGLTFSGIVSRGGHSTYRIRLQDGASHEDFLSKWAALHALGCTYEGSSANVNRLYSVDIPAGIDVTEPYAVLEEIEAQGFWEFEEAHYFQPDKG